MKLTSLFANSVAALALTLGFVAPSFATSDGNSRVAIVVAHVQDDTMFFIERAPVIGCYGISAGPALAQWTAEYKVPSNIGCGGQKFDDNINALTCAKIVDYKLSDTDDTVKSIDLDISKCDQKDNKDFITMVRTSASINFPQKDKKKEVKLTLLK